MSAPVVAEVAPELHDASEAFRRVVTLRSSSLRVEAGSIHALVGWNGVGKPTPAEVAEHPFTGRGWRCGVARPRFGNVPGFVDAENRPIRICWLIHDLKDEQMHSPVFACG